MDTVQLNNFVLLAQTLNFSTVAKQQFISQPALTKQINRLEEELGVRLFHRSKHGVSLTYAGEEFYRHAREILEHIDEAQHHMEFIQRGRSGSLTVSMLYGLDDAAANCTRAFIRGFPDIDVNIVSCTGAQQIQSINQQTSDVFFSYSNLLSLFPSLDTRPLPDDRFAVFVNSEDARSIRQAGLSYLDELNHLLEYRSEGGPLFTDTILNIRDALGLRNNRYSYYASNATILIAVQAGMGFALLPCQMHFGLCPPGVEMIPLEIPEAQIKRCLGYFRNSKNAAAVHYLDIARALYGIQRSSN